jgi:predicted lipid-binding transport protein (Tim44 family)
MRFATGRLVAPALFLAAGLLAVAAGAAVGQPGKDKEPGKEKKDKDKGKDGPKGGPEKGAKELRKAFDGITEAAQAPADKDAGKLLDHAKAFYRAAVKAHPDDPRKAGELALAVNDTVRGFEHARRAAFRPVADLPAPPDESGGPPTPKGKDAPPPKDGPKGKDARDLPADRGPWTLAFDALTAVQERLATAEAKTGAGRDFLDAAKTANRQARVAYEGGDYRKAAELARAADAWLRVTDHLDRAEWTAPPVAPEPKKGAPPLPPAKP